MKEKREILIEAHRGASGYCHQNTIEAFDKAIEMKADAIELDIRKTSDQKIIVVHDPLFKDIHINNWKYEDLIKETEKDGYVMPLFIDVLKKYKGKILLDIEIKEEGYEEEIVDTILSVLDINEFYIRSFHEQTIKTIKEYKPEIYTILLIGKEHVRFGVFSRGGEVFPRKSIIRSKCDAVSPNYQLLILWYTKRMHRKGIKVYAWTVNDERNIKKMIKKKVDGIVGNYPDLIKKLVSEE